MALLVGGAWVWWLASHDLLLALLGGDVFHVVVGVILVGPLALSLLVSTVGLVLEVVLPGTNGGQGHGASTASTGTG